ncbi:hypothetical protein FIBSPDRAFT_895134 [Athelia psychrophila]|uniref:Uncharacterized protein n=1 Tax=Athelia psychrophila TaxID=1759441 RepID=A0A166EYD6_9AGAM|nr:hypothetical protein FIBSPDRAFT_895134 [Fibularhizoctonia sp. CBS 109695]
MSRRYSKVVPNDYTYELLSDARYYQQRLVLPKHTHASQNLSPLYPSLTGQFYFGLLPRSPSVLGTRSIPSPPMFTLIRSCIYMRAPFTTWGSGFRVQGGDVEGREGEGEEEAEGGVAEELAEARGEGVYERVVEGREGLRRVRPLDVLARAALAPVLPPLAPVVVRLPLGAVRMARFAALVRVAQLLHAAPPEAPQAERVDAQVLALAVVAVGVHAQRVRELGLRVGLVLPVDVLAALVVARAQVRAAAHVRVVERVAAARARAQRAAAVPPELEERADDLPPRHRVVRAPQRVARVPLALLLVRARPAVKPVHRGPACSGEKPKRMDESRVVIVKDRCFDVVEWTPGSPQLVDHAAAVVAESPPPERVSRRQKVLYKREGVGGSYLFLDQLPTGYQVEKTEPVPTPYTRGIWGVAPGRLLEIAQGTSKPVVPLIIGTFWSSEQSGRKLGKHFGSDFAPVKYAAYTRVRLLYVFCPALFKTLDEGSDKPDGGTLLDLFLALYMREYGSYNEMYKKFSREESIRKYELYVLYHGCVRPGMNGEANPVKTELGLNLALRLWGEPKRLRSLNCVNGQVGRRSDPITFWYGPPTKELDGVALWGFIFCAVVQTLRLYIRLL